MDAEVEKQIGESERRFDLAKDRVYQLQLALESAEGLLGSTNHSGQRVRQTVMRVDADLTAAKQDLAKARLDLETAWALRNPNAEQIGEEQ